MGQNPSRKTAAAKRIFLSYLSLSKKSEKIQAYIGREVEVKVKITDHQELHNKNEKSNRAQTPCRNKIPNRNSNLFKPKWVKLGTLLKKFRN